MNVGSDERWWQKIFRNQIDSNSFYPFCQDKFPFLQVFIPYHRLSLPSDKRQFLQLFSCATQVVPLRKFFMIFFMGNYVLTDKTHKANNCGEHSKQCNWIAISVIATLLFSFIALIVLDWTWIFILMRLIYLNVERKHYYHWHSDLFTI